MFKLVLCLLFSINLLFAQGYIRPDQKTNNNDLRSNKVLFTIDSLKDKDKSYSMIISNNNQHIIVYSDDSRQRVAAGESEKIDNKYVREFIKMKYSMERVSESLCYKAYKLNMRGESQFICRDEINKLKILSGIMSDLDKLKK